MADKEATIYLIDVGMTMGECRYGRNDSDLEYGLRFFWSKIAETMATNRTTLSVGIIAFRTDETENPLKDKGYNNISIIKPLGKIEIADLDDLRARLVPSNTEDGDAISAVVVAISEIDKFTRLKTGKPGKFVRKIILLTDGQGLIDSDQSEEIIQKINQTGIELVVIGIDFDDPEFGFKEEDKPFLKDLNEKFLQNFVQKCDRGVIGTAAAAIQQISVPYVKTIRPFLNFEGYLTLGDPEKYPESTISIEVKRYFKTRRAIPPSASRYVLRTAGDLELENPTLDGGNFSAVRNARTYKVDDTSGPGGKKDIALEDLAKGYHYGRTIVPMNQADEAITKFETIQSFSIIGFIPFDKHEKYLNMGESCITIAQPVNDKARMSMSCLVHALHELESYAVARIVPKSGKEPTLVLQAPLIEPGELEALIDVPLPFAEDIRTYRFPPLDKVLSTSGVVLNSHRNLPSQELTDSMSDYVDAMDLSSFGKDENGLPTEYMPIGEINNPVIHRMNHAISQRAMFPDQPVSLPSEETLNLSNQPPELTSRTSRQLQRLIQAASVKKVPPKVKGKRDKRDKIMPLSGLDIESLLSCERRQKISMENPIPEFRQMLSKAKLSDDMVNDAVSQMSNIIRSLVTKSTGNMKYSQALECMRVFREKFISLGMPSLYNHFIRDFKNRLINSELGGNRSDFFYQMRLEKLGLIDCNTNQASDVTTEESQQFYICSKGNK